MKVEQCYCYIAYRFPLPYIPLPEYEINIKIKNHGKITPIYFANYIDISENVHPILKAGRSENWSCHIKHENLRWHEITKNVNHMFLVWGVVYVVEVWIFKIVLYTLNPIHTNTNILFMIFIQTGQKSKNVTNGYNTFLGWLRSIVFTILLEKFLDFNDVITLN